MAPTIAIPPSSTYPHKQVPRLSAKNNTKAISTVSCTAEKHQQELEELRKRNSELESALRDSKQSEQHLSHQLSKALERVRVAKEAEELLCSQLSDLEVEAVEHARDFHAQISTLKLQLLQIQSTT
ncbi:hypothetical protein vseg_010552 [Gypsophila vaccaria]